MPSSSRPQLAIYAALAIAVLLIGARFLRSGGGAGASEGGSASLPPSGAQTIAAALPGDGLGAVPPEDAGTQVVVDVKGAVRRPGVYRLAAGARALDAVRRAGGLTRRADRLGVNLAARVSDGGEVVVPPRGRAAVVATSGAGSTEAADAGPLSIDLNAASAEELEQLDGVGPATAAKIVAYRQEHGGIASVEELDEVSGIGPAKLAAIQAQLGR